MLHLSIPEISSLHLSSPSNRPCKMILPSLDSEVGKRKVPSITAGHSRTPEILSLHLILPNMKLIVSAVVAFSPSHLLVFLIRGCLSFGAADGTSEPLAGHCCSGELDTNGTLAGSAVVGLFADPGEVAYPVRVRVAGEHDVVADVVVV